MRMIQCPRCGNQLTNATQEFCPACLLQVGLQDFEKPCDSQAFKEEAASSDYGTVGLSQEETQKNHLKKIRSVGDYELLEEISRGGMGIVYKARQVSLNRFVAVKMILAGQLAQQQDIDRFFTEAEATARLDHPAIVPVYEFGEEEGQYYFSMPFVEGASLETKLSTGPFAPPRAAELTEKIAEAVEYAHKQGIVHRDLKPSNILIDSDGQPRITDFGLAKRLDSDKPISVTGQILGTAGYMSPEQAEGKTKKVGPAADVYALGALLYCLLTGRPPFQTATLLEILQQVRETEPVSPRQLNPTIPQDLETICLKCLEKKPERRYGSAEKMAADLNRWLSGQSIQARPVGKVERVLKWSKRRPVFAALMVTLTLFLVTLGAVDDPPAFFRDTLIALHEVEPNLMEQFLAGFETANPEMQNLQITDGKATATIILRRHYKSIQISFRRENNNWHLQLPLANTVLVSNTEKTNLQGRINFRGNPIEGGKITVWMVNGKSYSSPFDKDGSFRLTSIPVGKAKVTFQVDVPIAREHRTPLLSPIYVEIHKGINRYNFELK